MSEKGEEESVRPQKRNQKNVFVEKIKKISSLMRISRGSLHQEDIEKQLVQKEKKIRKSRKEGAAEEEKKKKNSESARRARLRKKLYLKLLQGQVDRLKEMAQEGRRVEKESQAFLQMVMRKEEAQERADEVGRYLSEQNLHEGRRVVMLLAQVDHQSDPGARMDKLIEQICQVSMCSSLRNIRQLSSEISVENILKSENVERRQVEGQELQEIIKEVLIESEELRQIYGRMVRENSRIKRSMEEAVVKLEDSVGSSNPLHLSSESEEQAHQRLAENFSTYLRRPQQPNNYFINLTQAQRILIQAQSFLELKHSIEDE